MIGEEVERIDDLGYLFLAPFAQPRTCQVTPWSAAIILALTRLGLFLKECFREVQLHSLRNCTTSLRPEFNHHQNICRSIYYADEGLNCKPKHLVGSIRAAPDTVTQ